MKEEKGLEERYTEEECVCVGVGGCCFFLEQINLRTRCILEMLPIQINLILEQHLQTPDVNPVLVRKKMKKE